MSRSSQPLALLLEDEMPIAIDVAMALGKGGFRVITCGRCAEAERWLEASWPDVAVIDVALPDGSSANVASTLIKREIPFLIHAGCHQQTGHLDSVFQAGTWIRRPAEPLDLAALARNLVGLDTI